MPRRSKLLFLLLELESLKKTVKALSDEIDILKGKNICCEPLPANNDSEFISLVSFEKEQEGREKMYTLNQKRKLLNEIEKKTNDVYIRDLFF